METLLEQIEKVKALLQRVPDKDLFFIKDLHGHYIWMNRSAEKFTGKTLSDVFMRKNAWNDDSVSEHLIISGVTPLMETRYQMKRPADGVLVFMNVFKTLLTTSDDDPVGILITAHMEESIPIIVVLIDFLSRHLESREREFIIHSINKTKNKDISEIMQISESTATRHKQTIMEKLLITEDEYNQLLNIIKELLNEMPGKKSDFFHRKSNFF